jgi:dTDP-4-dehydrorhamnose reductase
LKSIVIGSSGLIGRHLSTFLRNKEGHCIQVSRYKSSRNQLSLDLALNENDWDELPYADVAIICAGITSISDCEANKTMARIVNFQNSLRLTEKLVSKGTFVLILSSSLVFPDSNLLFFEDDQVNPSSQYAIQKVNLENSVTNLFPQAAILRLTKVISKEFNLFNAWSHSLRSGKEIKPFKNKYFAPITINKVIEAIYKILKQEASGIWHLSGGEKKTYAESALRLSDLIHNNSNLVVPVLSNENFLQSGANILGMNKTSYDLGIQVQEFEECMKSYLLN